MKLFKKNDNRQGFTIVELLVIIVIIGTLSALVTVSYVGVADLAKKATLSANAQTVLRSLKVYLADHEDFDPLALDETNVKSTLNVDVASYESLAMYNQAGENYIYIVGKDNFTGLVACGIQGNVNVYMADDAACAFGGSGNVVFDVNDSNPGVLGGGNGTTCALAKTVDSIEDLAGIARDVNSGLTAYSGVCIKLSVDLDFNQNKSYENKNDTQFGDINGNSVVEGIKTELTTGAGFVPIGTSARSFQGKFFGQLHTVYNLMINRPSTGIVGLFGKISNGQISLLNLTDSSVVGQDYASILTGASINSTISGCVLTGNITGRDYVGLVTGYFETNGYQSVSDVIANGNITGVNNVAGIVGSAFSTGLDFSMPSSIKAVYSGGSIITTGGNIKRIVGFNDRYYSARPYIAINSLALSTITINGGVVNSSDASSLSGASINSLSDLNEINLLETVFDTYIGGDNDGDGYYWDYGLSNNVVMKDIATYPLSFSLSGAGTPANPYLLSNYTDLKQAALKPNSSYKITSDIDLAGQKHYMIGSRNNPFTGSLDGNNKNISNLTINSPQAQYIGLIGFGSGGFIKGVKLSNANITSGHYSGALIGYAQNMNISDSIISGNVIGKDCVGLVIGYFETNGYQSVSNVFASGNITGINNVAGIVGVAYSTGLDFTMPSSIKAVYSGGSIITTGGNIKRIVGYNDRYYSGRPYVAISSLALSTITINGGTVVSASLSSLHGKDTSLASLSLSATYTDIGFNFTDEALDYIWYIDGASATFREGNL